jgi:hypothetical protein
MKDILFAFLFTIFYSTSNCQESPSVPIDSSTNLISYRKTLQLDQLSKDDIYSGLKVWIAKSFVSANSVIQNDDKEGGVIVLKSLFPVRTKMFAAGDIHFIMTFEFKNGKFRYEMTNFHHTGAYVSGAGKQEDIGPCERMINNQERTMGIKNAPYYNKLLIQLEENCYIICSSLETSMNDLIKRDDW